MLTYPETSLKIMDAKSGDFLVDEEEYMTKAASRRFIRGGFTHVREAGDLYTAHLLQHEDWIEVYVGERL